MSLDMYCDKLGESAWEISVEYVAGTVALKSRGALKIW